MKSDTLTLPTLSWEQDYDQRVNPELMTGLLRKAIPVLDQSDWYIDKVEEGFCESVLPLNSPTTNQHGTHQAALISLSADYTGGLALATLLRGVPLSGVHRCQDDNSASLWLASMNVKYRSPSSGHLVGTCRIDPKQAEAIRSRYFSGNRILATLEVQFHSNGDLVAIAEMKYFAQPTSQLTPAAGSKNRSALFSHKLKASARMIAGIRSRESVNPRLTAHCPHASVGAGPHGELLAMRLESALPQLTDMVLARTQHIDEVLREVDGLQQVVMLGAGLDMRPMRHAAANPGLTFFEIDLPEMIAERKRIVAQLPQSFDDQRVQLEVDFRSDDLVAILDEHPRFQRGVPTMFIYEGCSMYFTEPENQHLLKMVKELMEHPQSCLWADFVSREVVTGRTNDRSIAAFLEGMDELGEAFIFGVEDPDAWLKQIGLGLVETTRCGDYLNESDMVFKTYSFSVAKRWENS
ncbi:SAM-dependent methyltransferase [Fuerstiella marisgermanici]|uniref:Methyltransferase n=1 Tax=Fuerstiella marisgermanici TaxID=1891926 RepID=A0A1P8WED5_9PLAN|nr:SAM-dependent methyltransferase [Fuerstiella marisgermanici]APZ92434.1 methyltransferase [Fuerstiella marisgermanici]